MSCPARQGLLGAAIEALSVLMLHLVVPIPQSTLLSFAIPARVIAAAYRLEAKRPEVSSSIELESLVTLARPEQLRQGDHLANDHGA